MTAYVIFLIVLWIGIVAMLIAAAVVLLAFFGGGAALCVACRRLTGLRRKAGVQTEVKRDLKSDDKGAA